MNPEFPETGGPLPSNEPRPVSARVPERVSRGVFTSAQVVLQGPREVIIDFLQGLTRPHQVVARVVMPPEAAHDFIRALQLNIERYTASFGAPPTLPPQQNRPKPTLQDIYDHYKVPDEMLSGCYANSVLIGHSPSEFFFDFITGFFPTPAVSARVFIPASQAPRFLEMLGNAMRNRQPPPPPSEAPNP